MNLNAKMASLKAIQSALKGGFDVLSDTGEGLSQEIIIADKLTTWHNDSIFDLPSNGEQLDNCGEWVHPLSCPNHGQTTISGESHDRFVVMHTCDKPECPVCYTTWASKAAKRSTERLFEAQRLYKEAKIPLGRIDHIVFSPPREEAIEAIKTVAGYRKFKANAIKIIKNAGVKGGLIVFHPFRQNDPREKNFNIDVPAYVWYLSPHFHVVGSGYLQRSDEFHELTGWIYKKMDSRETVKGTIKYTLTHCGINENFHAITYFGALSYNKVVVDTVTTTEEPIKCRACGELLLEYTFKDEIDKENNQLVPDWNDELGVFYHKVKRRTFKLLVPKLKPVYNPHTCGYVMVMSKQGVKI